LTCSNCSYTHKQAQTSRYQWILTKYVRNECKCKVKQNDREDRAICLIEVRASPSKRYVSVVEAMSDLIKVYSSLAFPLSTKMIFTLFESPHKLSAVQHTLVTRRQPRRRLIIFEAKYNRTHLGLSTCKSHEIY
jgi:hypothetical protein